ncbi:MAG: sigma-70 family RNA polymerase sigma factor [Acidobacteria bacterium]|nr:sigma-70 family RNA polymerase sigma factor [Acidobacteriota bacterium]
MDDAELVRRCVAGDSAAWESIVRTHTRRIYNLCYRFTGQRQEAEDLTQEVFLRMFRTLKSYDPAQGALGVWLHRVGRNLLIDHYRATRRDRMTSSLDDELTHLGEKEAAPAQQDRQVALRELSATLQRALARLSPELREAVVLRDLQELEYREISQTLNIPEGTVKSRINRGRAFYSLPHNLGKYLLVDYLTRRRKQIA